jgi:hypothetical protein
LLDCSADYAACMADTDDAEPPTDGSGGAGGGNTGEPPPAECQGCQDVAQNGEPLQTWCPGSEQVYDELVDCYCQEATSPTCFELCAPDVPNICAGTPQNAQCVNCVMLQCGEAVSACVADTGAP